MTQFIFKKKFLLFYKVDYLSTVYTRLSKNSTFFDKVEVEKVDASRSRNIPRRGSKNRHFRSN